MKLSVRTRLALTFGGLFLLAGTVLLLVNYTLVSNALPEPTTYAANVVSAKHKATADGDGAGAAGNSGAAGDGAQPMEDPVVGGPAGPDYGSDGGNGGADDGVAVNRVFIGEVVTDYRSSAIQTLLVISGIALFVVGGLAGVAGWLMAGRVLRPVHRITTTARRLEAERMDKRINLDGPSDELKELADTFDGMLDRLAGSFDSQRRFVANASHELRTPLAVQRTLVEVAMADPTASPELMRLGSHLLHTNERTERLIEGLLVLARSDRGLQRREPVPLDHIVAATVEGARRLADDAGVIITTRLAARPVAGDPTLLERLVTNIVHNAIHYNRDGGTVLVEVGDWPSLVVTNTGPQVPPEAVSGLFEPFRRLDRDRTAHRAGAGLGLSIVRSVAHAHGGNVTATPNPAGGLRISVRLPLLATGRQNLDTDDVVDDTADPRVALGAGGGD